MNSAGELKSSGGSDVVELEITDGCDGGWLTDLVSGSLGVSKNGRGNGWYIV